MTSSRWRVWVALIAPPILLAIAFLPVVAYEVSVRALQGAELMRAVQQLAPLPASVAFLATFLLVRALMRKDGLMLADVGWRRPSGRDVIAGVIVAGVVFAADAAVFYPWLAQAQPSFDPTLHDMPLAAIVTMLGLGVLAEDTLYRGYAWHVLSSRHGAALALVVTTGFYALLAPGTEWPLKVWTVGFGLVLGAVRWWRGSVWPVIIVHGVATLAPAVLMRLAPDLS